MTPSGLAPRLKTLNLQDMGLNKENSSMPSWIALQSGCHDLFSRPAVTPSPEGSSHRTGETPVPPILTSWATRYENRMNPSIKLKNCLGYPGNPISSDKGTSKIRFFDRITSSLLIETQGQGKKFAFLCILNPQSPSHKKLDSGLTHRRWLY